MSPWTLCGCPVLMDQRIWGEGNQGDQEILTQCNQETIQILHNWQVRGTLIWCRDEPSVKMSFLVAGGASQQTCSLNMDFAGFTRWKTLWLVPRQRWTSLPSSGRQLSTFSSSRSVTFNGELFPFPIRSSFSNLKLCNFTYKLHSKKCSL